MEREGRLLTRDFRRYDTSHVVFRPRRMEPEELAQGYAWLYRRLFSHTSIWRRRPEDPRAVLPYLAMSYLYKRSNRLWHWLIKNDSCTRCGGRWSSGRACGTSPIAGGWSRAAARS